MKHDITENFLTTDLERSRPPMSGWCSSRENLENPPKMRKQMTSRKAETVRSSNFTRSSKTPDAYREGSSNWRSNRSNCRSAKRMTKKNYQISIILDWYCWLFVWYSLILIMLRRRWVRGIQRFLWMIKQPARSRRSWQMTAYTVGR